jgi:Calcium-activated BK potassium channel alpha subunit
MRSKQRQEDKDKANKPKNNDGKMDNNINKHKFKGSGMYSGMTKEQMMNGYMDSNGIWKESWQINYESGTKYELYRIPLKHSKFEGLKFRDVTMILFQKLGLVLIALEVKVMN